MRKTSASLIYSGLLISITLVFAGCASQHGRQYYGLSAQPRGMSNVEAIATLRSVIASGGGAPQGYPRSNVTVTETRVSFNFQANHINEPSWMMYGHFCIDPSYVLPQDSAEMCWRIPLNLK